MAERPLAVRVGLLAHALKARWSQDLLAWSGDRVGLTFAGIAASSQVNPGVGAAGEYLIGVG